MTPRPSMTLTNMRDTAKKALCDSFVLEKEFPAAVGEGLRTRGGAAPLFRSPVQWTFPRLLRTGKW